jgi:hypothetical protein
MRMREFADYVGGDGVSIIAMPKGKAGMGRKGEEAKFTHHGWDDGGEDINTIVV